MTAWTVARRELRERWMLFAASAVAAVMPFAIAAVRGSASTHGSEIIAAVGGILAVSFAYAIAVAMGSSVLGRELSENRLSFYFARPISPAAIWFGKAAAAIVAIVASFSIIAVPTYLASSQYWREYWSITSPKMAMLMIGGAVMLFLVTHAMSTMLRSRSALFVLDFVLFLAAVLVAALLVRPLLDVFAAKLAVGLIVGIAAAIAIVLAIAPVRQLAAGRTDRRRSHLALTSVVWPGVAVVLLLGGLFVAWVFSVKPGDLPIHDRHVFQAPTGRYLVVSGDARGRADYKPVFLVDATDGSVFRISSPPWPQVAFSRDGNAVAWLEMRHLDQELLAAVRRDDAVRRVHVNGLGQIALSDDGARVMIANDRSLSVYDVASDKLLATAQLSDFISGSDHAMYFVSPNVVRWVEFGRSHPGSLRIYELDVAKRHLTQTGSAVLPATGVLGVRASADGARLLVSWGKGWDHDNAYRVLDGRTGAVQQEFTARSATFLGDGTIAAMNRGANGQMQIGNVELPLRSGAITREVSPGVILAYGGLTAVLVDVRKGAVVRTFDHMQALWSGFQEGDVRAMPVNGARPLVLADPYGKISRVDAATGAKTPIL